MIDFELWSNFELACYLVLGLLFIAEQLKFSSFIGFLCREALVCPEGKSPISLRFYRLSLAVVGLCVFAIVFSYESTGSLLDFAIASMSKNAFFIAIFVTVLTLNMFQSSAMALSQYFSYDRWLFCKNYIKGLLVQLLTICAEYLLLMVCFLSFNLPVCILFPTCYYSVYQVMTTLVFTGIQSYVEELLCRKIYHKYLNKIDFTSSWIDSTLGWSHKMSVCMRSAFAFGCLHVSVLGGAFVPFRMVANFINTFSIGLVFSYIYESEVEAHKHQDPYSFMSDGQYEGIGAVSAMHNVYNTWIFSVQDTYVIYLLANYLNVPLSCILGVRSVITNAAGYVMFYVVNKPFVELCDSIESISSSTLKPVSVRKDVDDSFVSQVSDYMVLMAQSFIR